MSKPARKPSALRRIARDPRVSARGFGENVSGRSRFRVRNSARFAGTVIARHVPRLGLGPLLEMILRRRAHLELHQTVVHSAVNVNVAPLLTVNLLHPRPLQLAAPRREHLVKSEFHRLVLPERRLDRTIIERLIAREVRHESRSLAAGSPSELAGDERSERRTIFPGSAGTDAPLESPVRRVFRRPAQSVNPQSPPGAAPRRVTFPAEPGILEPPALRSAAPRVAERISPQELSRITDHVIDTIDRGIIASRERRGLA